MLLLIKNKLLKKALVIIRGVDNVYKELGNRFKTRLFELV
jgi:NifU-like protein involved in Fe-S cluster formation